MGKLAGNALARDLFNALNDARTAFSPEERCKYDPETLEEMFQYQFNVNLRAAAEARRNQKDPLTARTLEYFACCNFPDYNEKLNVKSSLRLAENQIRNLKKMLSDIRQLPPLEDEDPIEPSPSLNTDRRQPNGPRPV